MAKGWRLLNVEVLNWESEREQLRQEESKEPEMTWYDNMQEDRERTEAFWKSL